jgi:hypothetical protein
MRQKTEAAAEAREACGGAANNLKLGGVSCAPRQENGQSSFRRAPIVAQRPRPASHRSAARNCRLVSLFPSLSLADEDGLVADELVSWHLEVLRARRGASK